MSDLVALTQEKLADTDTTPREFRQIRETFEELKETGEQIIYEENSEAVKHSVVLTIDYVSERWAKGYASYVTHEGKEERVPYTIQYANLFIARHITSPPKLMRATENPFMEEDST